MRRDRHLQVRMRCLQRLQLSVQRRGGAAAGAGAAVAVGVQAVVLGAQALALLDQEALVELGALNRAQRQRQLAQGEDEQQIGRGQHAARDGLRFGQPAAASQSSWGAGVGVRASHGSEAAREVRRRRACWVASCSTGQAGPETLSVQASATEQLPQCIMAVRAARQLLYWAIQSCPALRTRKRDSAASSLNRRWVLLRMVLRLCAPAVVAVQALHATFWLAAQLQERRGKQRPKHD